jgi:plasmid stabilization system protein ParE
VTRRVVLRPTAKADIDAAAAWLEEQSPRSAARFWRPVDQTLQGLRENPFQYQRVVGEARRAPLRRFGYALFYRVTEDEIVVVACTHGRRHPKRWQDRIPE